MKKLKLLAIICLLTFTATSQTTDETFQTHHLFFEQSAESEVVSEELNQEPDSIVVESFLP